MVIFVLSHCQCFLFMVFSGEGYSWHILCQEMRYAHIMWKTTQGSGSPLYNYISRKKSLKPSVKMAQDLWVRTFAFSNLFVSGFFFFFLRKCCRNVRWKWRFSVPQMWRSHRGEYGSHQSRWFRDEVPYFFHAFEEPTKTQRFSCV